MSTDVTVETSDSQSSQTADGPNPFLLRLGGGLGALGGIFAIVFFLVRPRTPSYAGEVGPILDVFALNGRLFEIHTLGISVALLLVLAGFVALEESLDDSHRAAAYGKLGVVAVVVTAALFLIDTSIDGTVLVEIARTWEAASGSQQPSVEYVAELGILLNVVILGRGVFLFSLAVLLFGLGTAASERYPNSLGYAGVVFGAIGLVAGGLVAAQGVPTETMILPVFVAVLLAFAWVSVACRFVWKLGGQLGQGG